MELNSLFLDHPEPSPLTGAKRLPASPGVDRESKRLRTQLNQWPPGNAVLEMSNLNNSWGGGNIISNPEFGNYASQYGILETSWTGAASPGDLGGHDSILHPPTAENDLFLFNSMPSPNLEIDMQSSQLTDKIYDQTETPRSANALDLDYSVYSNKSIYSGAELSQVPNSAYNSYLIESSMFHQPSFLFHQDPQDDTTLTWIDGATELENTGGYKPPGHSTLPRPETEELATEGDGMLVASFEEEKKMGNEDNSEYSSTVISPINSFSGFDNPSQPVLSELTPTSFVIDPNQVDICFGVVIAHVTSSWNGSHGMNVTPVTISALADVMKLSFQDSKKYAGLLNLPALCKLQGEFTIEYTAKMAALKSRNNQRLGTGKAKLPNSTHNCSVRIVIYGVKSEGYAVGKLLSDAGLYLQHPSATELYRHVDYWNPHYLLRPGSQIPKREALSISADRNNATTTENLDEAHKSCFMQIFNSANGPISPFDAMPSPRLQSILKDHQLTALAMMTEKECGIVKDAKFPTLWSPSINSTPMTPYRHKITGTCHSSPTPIYGGILADAMGLGKSLCTLALVCSSLDSLTDREELPEDGMSRATLIVTPKSTIPGWQQQVERHVHAGQLRLAVYHGPNKHLLSSNFWKTDIVLTTYETLRLEWAATGPLYSGTWRRVVLDEAHHIRNRSSQSFKAASAVSSKSRWCLTGTPIHNSLDDYGALLSFLGIPFLTEKSEFDFWIASPIKRKRTNSLSTLGDLIRATCLRRTKDMTQDSLQLPGRIERIEEVKLHQADQRLYDFFKEKTAKIAAGLARPDEGALKQSRGEDANILTLLNFLRRICNHGEDLLPQSALEAWRLNSMSLDWQMMQNCNKNCDSCGSLIEEVDFLSDDNPEFGCHHSICTTCSMQSEKVTTDEMQKCPKYAATRATSRNPFSLPTPSVRLSAKVEALIRNLASEQALEQHEDKALPVKRYLTTKIQLMSQLSKDLDELIYRSVIFSYWTKMLDLIEKALLQHGFRFQRIDGQSSLQQRSVAMQQFKEDPACTVIIASIGSAGEGVDLTVSSRVHLMEPHWSPMAEAQAVDRVHRIGQTREVVITRYIVSNTIETYIQWVQQDKLKLIRRSLDLAVSQQGDIDDARWKMLQKALGTSNQ